MSRAVNVNELVWTVGDRLRKAREVAGYDDQTEFAKVLGVSRGTVSNAERGTVRVRAITLRAWAMATGVPVSYLETGTVPPEGPEGPSFTVRHQGLEPRTRWFGVVAGRAA